MREELKKTKEKLVKEYLNQIDNVALEESKKIIKKLNIVKGENNE